ncbi:MAG: hypothetical protein JSR76_03960 [Verrucomicrobia bacterium]|nr:hypothetical protein [Verrucomicrobiota bacterium]
MSTQSFSLRTAMNTACIEGTTLHTTSAAKRADWLLTPHRNAFKGTTVEVILNADSVTLQRSAPKTHTALRQLAWKIAAIVLFPISLVAGVVKLANRPSLRETFQIDKEPIATDTVYQALSTLRSVGVRGPVKFAVLLPPSSEAPPKLPILDAMVGEGSPAVAKLSAISTAAAAFEDKINALGFQASTSCVNSPKSTCHMEGRLL